MPEPKNVLVEPLRTCSLEPRTGVTRSANCETRPQAIRSHTICELADLKPHAVDLC